MSASDSLQTSFYRSTFNTSSDRNLNLLEDNYYGSEVPPQVDEISSPGTDSSETPVLDPLKSKPQKNTEEIRKISLQIFSNLSALSPPQRTPSDTLALILETTKPLLTELNLSKYLVGTLFGEKFTDVQDYWNKLQEKTKDCPSLDLFLFNEKFSRFNSILTIKKTLVEIEGVPYHANLVGEGISQQRFIMGQAPSQVSNSNFWKMIHVYSPVIFDLTHYTETISGGRLEALNCYPNEKLLENGFGEVTVKLLERNSLSDSTFQISTYEVMWKSIKKIITHYRYPLWSDRGIITLKDLNEIVKKIEEKNLEKFGCIPFIHCGSGVGRSGVVAAAAVIKEKIDANEVNFLNFGNILVEIVYELRQQRSLDVINAKEQFSLLFNYGTKLLRERKI